MRLSPCIPYRPAAFVCAILLLGACTAQLQAQQPSSNESPQQGARPPRVAEDTLMAIAAPAASAPLLERQISRSEYRLGPGDVVAVSVFGFQNALFSLTVTPEGSIVIPGVRIVQVAGLSIDEAEERVRQQVRRIYPNSDVGVSLSTVRSFRVYLAGDVLVPGAASATPVTRVGQLIEAENSEGVIYRNVKLRRSNGEEINADLARFIRTGDLSSNPTVSQGDMIHVPAVNQTVTVSGRVAYPGIYEYRPAETLAELLHLANGGGTFPSDAADSVILMRFSEDPNGQVRTISRDEAMGALGTTLLLEPSDGIFIPRMAHYRSQTTAIVEGEVRRPGRYPIRPGMTSVQELIEMAGGYTPEAALSRAVLRRESGRMSGTTSTEPEPEPVRSSLDEVSLAQLTREERRSLQVTSRVDENDILINLAPDGPAETLTLMNEDVLFVPRRRNDVIVLGAAARPGIVPYAPNRTVDYFVELAGGYSRRADVGDVVVEREGLGVRFHWADLPVIEPGDRIIIPFRERKTFLDHVETAQLLVGTISGFALSYFALERLWR